jgi:hypothetical protein
MANEIVKASQLPINEIMSIGKAFAESGMFPDTRQAAQAIVKIQAGQEIGIPPFAAMTGIHIIQGKPTIGANIIAAKIKSSGKYDYKVVEQTDKICSLDFYEGKTKIGNSTFTIEDARKAQTKNLDKFPKNMLFARAISNGVKWFTPDVFMAPVYTPEDFDTVRQTEDINHEEIKPEVKQLEQPKKSITDKALNEALNRIKNGELEVYTKLLETCNLKEQQKELLETVFAEANTANETNHEQQNAA